MHKSISLKAAVAVSLSLHLAMISSWDSFFLGGFKDRDEIKNNIEVTYVVRKLTEDPALKAIPTKYDLDQKKTVIKSIQAAPKKEDTLPNRDLSEKSLFVKKASDISDIKNLEEYIAYYELLREKIRIEVSKQYTRPIRQGIVHLIFKLKKSGKIKEILVDESKSTNSKFLKRLAIKSLRAAEPFPSFPRALKREELVFNVSIIFKKE